MSGVGDERRGKEHDDPNKDEGRQQKDDGGSHAMGHVEPHV